MEYDWQFKQRSECSDQDKRGCMKLVGDLVNLSIMARRNGLLSLIKVAEQKSHFLLKKGLQLLVDGVSPQIVRNVLENYIISGDYTGKTLLENCIILEGVIAIQQGLHPKVTKEFLLSFLGEGVYAAFQKEYEAGAQTSLESYLKSIESTTASSPKGAKLDQLIIALDDDGMDRFLMEINTGDLALSLKGMGGAAQTRIFGYLSPKAADGLKDAFEDLKSIDEEELDRIQDMAIDMMNDILEVNPDAASK